MKTKTLPAYFFISEERLLLEEAAAQERQKIGAVVDTDWDLFVFDSKTCNIDQVIDSLSGFPLGNGLRLVIVSNSQLLTSSQSSRLQACLTFPLVSSVLILSGEKIANCSGIKKIVEKFGGFRKLEKPKGSSMLKWVQQQANKFDRNIGSGAAQKLIELAGDDLQALNKEIEKLALGSLGQEISMEQVEKSASRTPQAKFFQLIDAVLEKKRAQAYHLLAPVLADSGAFSILEMLKRRYREMLGVKLLIKRGVKTGFMISKELGLNPFVAENLRKQSALYSEKDLVKVFNFLLDTEINTKSGVDHAFSMENLICRISTGKGGIAW
jgi:DNA polymerase-3 subunit delta